MHRIPRILGITEISTVSFYEYRALGQCTLKASTKNLRLAGQFHHQLMKYAASVGSAAELERCIEAEILTLQSQANACFHLSHLGSVSGWDTVNTSAQLAMRLLASRRQKRGNYLVCAERELRSKDGTRVGRPDYFEVFGKLANLREYKTGPIRDNAGRVRHDYQLQLLFYSGLIIDSHGVERISATLQSSAGDSVERLITFADTDAIAREVITAIEEANEQIRSAAALDQLARPSKTACEFCQKRPICAAFKNAQSHLGFTRGVYVLEGRVLKQQHSANGKSVQLYIEESSRKTWQLSIPQDLTIGVREFHKYVLVDLEWHAAGPRWGNQSRICSID